MKCRAIYQLRVTRPENPNESNCGGFFTTLKLAREEVDNRAQVYWLDTHRAIGSNRVQYDIQEELLFGKWENE